MTRIINGIHPDVYLESGDCVIFSSKIIPGNEKKLYHLQNLIVKNKMEMISEENAFVHVSGHPNREDLKEMYNWVKPQCIIQFMVNIVIWLNMYHLLKKCKYLRLY